MSDDEEYLICEIHDIYVCELCGCHACNDGLEEA